MIALDSPLQRAKERFSIPLLWQVLGLAGSPARSCKSPFRKDRKASFAIYADGSRWHDFGSSDGGDAVDFVARALSTSLEDAARKLIELAGSQSPMHIHRPTRDVKNAGDQRESKRGGWPLFESCTREEIACIAELRGLSCESVSIAAGRGLLFCADSIEGRAWIISDSYRKNAQARLLSGRPWAAGMKAKTLPGSEAAWPIGLREAEPFQGIALVEGGPDLLAAIHLAWCIGAEDLIAPVAMLGASNQIPETALSLFASKRVRIFMHEDVAGHNAARRWALRLATVAARVDGFSFEGSTQDDGIPVNDLNEFAHLSEDEWENARDAADQAFNFVAKTPPSRKLKARRHLIEIATIKEPTAKLAA
jgi:hypothetical protein